jgi:hypothetical protein
MPEPKKPSKRAAKSAASTAASSFAPPAAKSAVAKPAAPVATASPAASKPAAGAKPSGRTISSEERARMVQEAAYYRAEKRGFTGDPHEDWVAAEQEISSKLARENIRVV